MNTPLPASSFNAASYVNHLFHISAIFIKVSKFLCFFIPLIFRIKHASQSDFFTHHRRWHLLSDFITNLEIKIQNPGRILDRCFCLHGAVSNDLSNSFFAILLSCILNNITTTTIVEVHVDIRHRNTIRVQKPLKQQSMENWI